MAGAGWTVERCAAANVAAAAHQVGALLRPCCADLHTCHMKIGNQAI